MHEDGRRWLFKYARVNAGVTMGEDWAEKIAAELAILIGLPAAMVELAQCQGQRGVVSFDFTCEPVSSETPHVGANEWQRIGALVHGNELLVRLTDSTYPAKRMYRVSEHTVDRIMEVLGNDMFLPPISSDPRPQTFAAADVFVGYLLLDAWIGNTDRHHENWGVIASFDQDEVRLSPTYDHASSLGRNLSEAEFSERLVMRDENRTIEAYIAKARSALYANQSERRPLSTMAAFRAAAALRSQAGEYWCQRLGEVDPEQWRSIIDKIPDTHMSDAAKTFVDKLLAVTYACVLGGGAESS